MRFIALMSPSLFFNSSCIEYNCYVKYCSLCTAALQCLEVCSHEAAMDTLRRTVVRSCGLARQLGRQQGARSASSLHPHNQVATTRQPGTADCNLF